MLKQVNNLNLIMQNYLNFQKMKKICLNLLVNVLVFIANIVNLVYLYQMNKLVMNFNNESMKKIYLLPFC